MHVSVGIKNVRGLDGRRKILVRWRCDELRARRAGEVYEAENVQMEGEIRLIVEGGERSEAWSVRI